MPLTSVYLVSNYAILNGMAMVLMVVSLFICCDGARHDAGGRISQWDRSIKWSWTRIVRSGVHMLLHIILVGRKSPGQTN